MPDYEKLTPIFVESESDCDSVDEPPRTRKKRKSKKSKRGGKKSKTNDRDDLSGMFLNMLGKVDIRELLIIWLAFLFIHTPAFITHFLKRFKGAYDDTCSSMTMKGTFYSSLFMILIVVICTMLF